MITLRIVALTITCSQCINIPSSLKVRIQETCMFRPQFRKDNISNIRLQGSEMSLIIIAYPILIQQFLEILDFSLKVGDSSYSIIHSHSSIYA